MLCPPELREIETDVLVLGGGLPGVCAAIQAAQMGVQVVLVERGLALGGNCGPEVGVHPSDAHRFHPYMASTGTVGRLIEDAAFSAAKTETAWYHYNISNRWDGVMAQALKRAGVTVLRRHYAHTPEVDNGRITAVYCEDTATYKRVRIAVRGMVIDDTGDGNVSERAGAEWRMGREGKAEFGERIAPEQSDAITMGSSVVVLVRKTDREVKFVAPEGTPPFHPGYGGMVDFHPGEGDTLRFFFPCETGGDIDTIEDDHAIYERLLPMIYSAWNRIKNEVAVEASRNWELLWISRVAKRESRRFVGDYMLTENDLEAGAIPDDSIAMGGFALDIHYPRPENREYVKIVYHSIPPLYGIPFRSIYSRNVDNLLFASRLLSASHLAHGSVRLQRTLATVGQAAGAAAAMCVRLGLTPRQLYRQGHVPALQRALADADATIPVPLPPNPRDMAPCARARATSEARYGVSGAPTFAPIDRLRGVELWDFADRIDEISFRARNRSGSPIALRARALRYAPERPWKLHGERPFFDYYPHRNEAEWGSDHLLAHFRELGRSETQLAAGFDGWATLPLGIALAPKNPMNDDDRVLVLLEPAEGAELALVDGFFEFVRSVEGEENGEYLARPRACLYSLSPAPAYGEAGQAIVGPNRRYSTNPIAMWRPAELPATIELTWDAPFAAGALAVTLDTLTRAAHDMPFECNRRAAGQCARTIEVSAYAGGARTFAATVEDHYHRVLRLDLGGAACDRLAIRLVDTWEAGSLPGVYRIQLDRAD
ncbi:MAG: FAD-dependent oxidoreductase [Clostridiales bacterium]|nr:FAD-dependent oxidoreductase [Clostridiales bacterium]